MSYRAKQKQASRAKLTAAVYNFTVGLLMGLTMSAGLYLNLL